MTQKTDDKKPEPMVPVRALKGYQPLDTNLKKVAKGQGLEVPLSEAKAGIAAKVLERADPLPGED